MHFKQNGHRFKESQLQRITQFRMQTYPKVIAMAEIHKNIYCYGLKFLNKVVALAEIPKESSHYG